MVWRQVDTKAITKKLFEFVNKSGLFDLVDGYVLSYQEHKIKPYKAIYNVLLERYNLIPNECIFIDDNQNNIESQEGVGEHKIKTTYNE